MSRSFLPENLMDFQEKFWDSAASLPELGREHRARLPSAFAIRQMTAMEFLNLPHQPYPKVDN